MTEATIVQHDEEAERSVLGSLMISETAIDAVLGGALEAEHFFRPRHRRVFRAIAALVGRSDAVDALTVCDELGPDGISDVGGREFVYELGSTTAVPGNAAHYARIVLAKSEWRHRRQAVNDAAQAVRTEDEAALDTAMAALHANALEAEFEFSGEEIGMAMLDMADGKVAGELLEWPYPRLNHLRTMLKGNLVVLTGPSHHGKSLIGYAILDHLYKQGKAVRLYPNEMNADEIGTQSVWRRSAIPTDRLEMGTLSQPEQAKLLQTLNEWNGNGWGVTEIHGWKVERVANHIERRRDDLAVVDILHNFEYEHERELDHIVGRLQIAAKRANTCVVLVAHINRGRTLPGSGEIPKPRSGDIRASGGIYNRADVVACVWREQDDEMGDPLEDGVIYLLKARRGKLGGFPVKLRDSDHGNFIPVDNRPEPTDRYLHHPEDDQEANRR